MSSSRAPWRYLVAAMAALGIAGTWFAVDTEPTPNSSATQSGQSGQDQCPTDTLPEEAEETIDAILTDQDQMFTHHDGSHFGNYERRLPLQGSDYYREYTVDTPGVNHRGARRIVVGGGTENDPEVWYYTSDHYESFCLIPDAED
ncbi:ribonuclease [Corynebacterium sp. TAE3-ERU12]|uniref:ribonuclease domain-containing protein n=1 Tax=Corynebacterium sp. TAE3-ERU12 TaxID=2849491 RepID=UPI001C4897D4|nr:ribonuclease domain-containing protein [Corynebacterium sp. TAE3-ERU12]MBV7295783.1 ribonuclease [Corynebacterium sp. TAE3-ERU12]